MTVPMRQIGQVCSLQKGGVNPQKFPAELFAHYSIPAFDEGMKPSMDLGASIRSQKTAIQSGSVLVSKLNPRIPRVWHVQDEQEARRICSTEFVPLLPKRNVLDPRYLVFALLHLLASGAISGSTSAATKSRERAKPADIAQMLIPVPPLERQTEIADLLSRAEGIVRLRREAAAKAAELIPALFIHHFGDPATNPMGWQQRKVSDFVAKFVGGKNIQAGDGAVSPLRILKVSAVTSGQYLEHESKPAPNDHVAPTEHIVRKGDLLFSRANTSELVGATALVEQTNGTTLLPDKLWRFVWREEVEPIYAWALFQSKHVRQELSQLASGTSDSMRNISQAKLFELSLPWAPMEAQRAFAEQARAAQSIGQQQTTALAKAQATFDALLAQAFAPV